MYNPSSSSAERFYPQTARRGKHKIFIGMAPGVGKTYKMLEEAHLLKQEGIDVVIGVIETHGRKETAVSCASALGNLRCVGAALTAAHYTIASETRPTASRPRSSLLKLKRCRRCRPPRRRSHC